MDMARLIIQIVISVIMLLTLVAIMIKLVKITNGNTASVSGYMGPVLEALKVIFQPLSDNVKKMQEDIVDIHKKLDKKFMTKEVCGLEHKAHNAEHVNMTKDLKGYGKRLSDVEGNVKSKGSS